MTGLVDLRLLEPLILHTQGWLATSAPARSIKSLFRYEVESCHGSGRWTPALRRYISQHHAHWLAGQLIAPTSAGYLDSLSLMLAQLSDVSPAVNKLVMQTFSEVVKHVDVKQTGAWRKLLKDVRLREYYDGAPQPLPLHPARYTLSPRPLTAHYCC